MRAPAQAWDNSPAAFSGAPLVVTNIPEFSTVHIGVEFSPGGYVGGSSLHRVDRYVQYSGGMGPFSGLNSCSKWMPRL